MIPEDQKAELAEEIKDKPTEELRLELAAGVYTGGWIPEFVEQKIERRERQELLQSLRPERIWQRVGTIAAIISAIAATAAALVIWLA